MKCLLLYILKGKHEKKLDKFHVSKYTNNRNIQDYFWKKVMNLRRKIRRIEPNFLAGFDDTLPLTIQAHKPHQV